VCHKAASVYPEVWKIDDASVVYGCADLIWGLLVNIIPKGSIVLVPHEHFGMDLAPGFSIKLDTSFLADVIDLETIVDGKLRAVRQEYNGQVSVHMECDVSCGAVLTIRPGSFQPDKTKTSTGEVIDKTSEALEHGLPQVGRRFLEVVEADAGDVGITKADVLISVGKGIEEEDNIHMVRELAKAFGGEVSCSRPIVVPIGWKNRDKWEVQDRP
jgi:electron transfer flavoprotein alpha subunit